MTKQEKTQAAFEMILRIQNGCSPIIWSIDDRHGSDESVCVTIEDCSPRSIDRLMNDEIRENFCMICVNKGKFQVIL